MMLETGQVIEADFKTAKYELAIVLGRGYVSFIPLNEICVAGHKQKFTLVNMNSMLKNLQKFAAEAGYKGRALYKTKTIKYPGVSVTGGAISQTLVQEIAIIEKDFTVA